MRTIVEAQIELAQSGKAEAVIVLDDSATARETSVTEGLRKYLGEVTGASFAIVGTEAAPAGMARIFVGDSLAIRELVQDVQWDALGTDDIVLRTVGNNLILSGGRPRGTIHAIYTFRHDTVGCRWWTRGAESLPSKPALTVPPLNIRYRPPFEMRVIRSEIGWMDRGKTVASTDLR